MTLTYYMSPTSSLFNLKFFVLAHALYLVLSCAPLLQPPKDKTINNVRILQGGKNKKNDGKNK